MIAITNLAVIAQLGERRVSNSDVVGSNPSNRILQERELMLDKNKNKLKNGDTVCILPSYEESQGGQIYQMWYGNITIINDTYYLDDEVLTPEMCNNIIINNVKKVSDV